MKISTGAMAQYKRSRRPICQSCIQQKVARRTTAQSTSIAYGLASQACQRRLSEKAKSRIAQGTAWGRRSRRATGARRHNDAQLAKNGNSRSAKVPSSRITITSFSSQRKRGGAASAKRRGPRRWEKL